MVSGILPDSPGGELRSYRRNLPHWRIDGATYLVTWRLWSTQEPLRGEERALDVSALLFFHQQRYCIHAYVVMEDHIHVIVQPFDGVKLERVIHVGSRSRRNR
jgi:putative transposase